MEKEVDEDVIYKIVRFKIEKILFIVLSVDEVISILEVIDKFMILGLRNMVLLEFIYGFGLCVFELFNIKLKDIYM